MQTRPIELSKPYLTGCIILAALFLVLGVAGSAHAVCTDLGGTPTATECLLTSAQNKSGAFTIEGTLTLHFVNSGGGAVGSITTGGADLSITGLGGLVMDAGTFINADKTGGTCPTGGTVDLTFGGDVTLKPGSVISSDSCSGGFIHIKGGQNVDINGLLSSFGSNKSAFSATQIAPAGGPITVETPCNLTVTPEGVISSRGKDSGADLVRLVGGCFVKVFGLVESTGGGHRVPNTPPNHCGPAGGRPGKPADSTACVEIVAGDLLVIDAVAPNNGEINVDSGGIGGSGSQWADIFARGPIQILGDVNPPFAVHGNGLSGANDKGAIITVKSRDSNVTVTGLAIQADATKGGGAGGVVVVEGATSVNLDDSQILARGDMTPTNGFGTGGRVSAHAWQSFLNWRDTATAPASIGDVRPVGSPVPPAQWGTINLLACTTLSTAGTSFPTTGPAGVFPATATGSCGAGPSFPAYIVFPDCTCALACP